MAARTKKQKRCYVYRVFDGHETIYVGKGTGRRRFASAKRFGASSEILEDFLTDVEAFAKEVEWIGRLMPTSNISKGGAGAYTRSNVPLVPRSFRGKISEAEMRRCIAQGEKAERQMAEMGARRYVAKYLAQKLNIENCESWGVSKVDMFRILEVANGQGL